MQREGVECITKATIAMGEGESQFHISGKRREDGREWREVRVDVD
jgi:hypothetical protein